MLAAFGVTEEPVRLGGGRGGAWQAGGLVLKPVDFLPETLWRAEVLQSLPDSADFRIARPVRTAGGTWVAGGWEASCFVAGHPDATRTDDVLRTGIAFHRALAGLARPGFLVVREDPWSVGDRAAWAERPAAGPEVLLGPLLAARTPVELPAQPVHGDLLGNVLFADGMAPAVIDWPVYWRPVAWSLAVAVVDALCHHGAGADLVDRWAHLAQWRQMLVRALIFRVVAHDHRGWTATYLDDHRRALELVLP